MQIEPGKLLVSTYWSSMEGLPDVPESYKNVRYELSPEGLGTRLTVTQDNNATSEDANHSGDNWKMVLNGIKKLLEGGNIMKRIMGRSGIEVSALGMGCWAIGGPFWAGSTPNGWGEVDDEESIRAIHKALEMGVTLFDTANVYGAGHSERVLARAFEGRRSEVVIATKFNAVFDETTRQVTGSDATPAGIRAACEASLRRLNTDYIDLYQFHDNGFRPIKPHRSAKRSKNLSAQARSARMAGAPISPGGRRYLRKDRIAAPYNCSSTFWMTTLPCSPCAKSTIWLPSTVVHWPWAY